MASPRALCRFDRYGDWCIAGGDAHIFADGKGSLIMVMTGESVRRWNNVKKRLAFAGSVSMVTTKDAFTFDRLPTADEADLIRGANVTCHRKH